jgi:hypothetical protein
MPRTNTHQLTAHFDCDHSCRPRDCRSRGFPTYPQSTDCRSEALFRAARGAQLQRGHVRGDNSRLSNCWMVWRRVGGTRGGALALFVLTFVYTPDLLTNQSQGGQVTIRKR